MHPRTLTLICATAALALACSDPDLVAQAGKTEVRRAEIEIYGGARSRQAAPKAQLEAVADRALLAEAARRDGLEADPKIRARIASARREILAQAYLDRELVRAEREDVLRARYAAEKDGLTRKRVRVAHIAVRVAGPGDVAAAQSRVSRAYARLSGGEPFERVARELSEDRVTAERGGDLGPILEGQVDPAFFAQAAGLAKGEVSKPFESPFGWHIVRALAEPETVTPSFEEVRGVLAVAAQRQAEEALRARLRKEITVKLHPERLPGAAAQGAAGEGR